MSTKIDEVGDGIYRVSTPVSEVPGGFSFNQYLIVDDEPLLFHTGQRMLFTGVRAAIERVLPIAKLRHIGFSHYESDECGSLNQLLAVAPQAAPLCGRINTMINADAFDRAPRTLADGETISTGKRTFRWIDAPHVPHAWECGYLFEETTRTLLCSDLFTQGGLGETPVTESEVLGPSEEMRKMFDYWAHSSFTRPTLERLAALAPVLLTCMHGSAYRGDGGKLLRELADALDR